MAIDTHNPAESAFQGLRVATAPVNWNNNDLEGWRPVVPFPDILHEMQAAGYRATEWDQNFGTDVETLHRERLRRDIEFVGAYRWLDFANDDRFERDVEAISPFLHTLQGIGASHLIVADTLRPERLAIAGAVPVDGSASLNEGALARVASNVDRLADIAGTFDLSVHYHNHVGSFIETSAEVEALLDHLADSRVDLCFDTGHFAFGGGDALEFLRQYSERVGYIHLKDVDHRVLDQARANRWNFLDALRNYIFSPIGEGNARLEDVIGLLVRDDFQGHVVIEQDTCRGNATENARANLDMVRRFESAPNLSRRIDA
jgi:inosose dehydratase